MTDDVFVTVNGRPLAARAESATQSLLRWLQQQGLTGSKEGCGDGDCGACTVLLFEADAQGRPQARAVNSCLLPLGAVVGRRLLTVEGLAEGERLHPVQRAMADCGGSQCGYCTPGFVMSMAAGWCEGDSGDAVIEGNLCRCTGYLPIRRAMSALAQQPMTGDDRLAMERAAATPPAAAVLGAVHSPTRLDDALELKSAHPEFDWLAGGTDLGVELGRGRAKAAGYIALDRISDLQHIQVHANEVRIGAGVSLSRIEHELAGVFPMIDRMLPWFAGRQVKNRGTIGGNLGSASPIGDLLPVLLAADADVELLGRDGARHVPIAGYFTGYRTTLRRPDELITAVRLPLRPDWISTSYKLSKRPTDDISIVAAAFALSRKGDGEIVDVRLAYGGVAAIPARAIAVEEFLRGRVLDRATVEAACQRLREAFTPLSDARASADYRRSLTANLFARFVAEHAS